MRHRSSSRAFHGPEQASGHASGRGKRTRERRLRPRTRPRPLIQVSRAQQVSRCLCRRTTRPSTPIPSDVSLDATMVAASNNVGMASRACNRESAATSGSSNVHCGSATSRRSTRWRMGIACSALISSSRSTRRRARAWRSDGRTRVDRPARPRQGLQKLGERAMPPFTRLWKR